MFGLGKKEEPYHQEQENKSIKVIIQHTYNAVYVYECVGEPFTDRLGSAIDLEDEDGNRVSISGSLISIVVSSPDKVREALNKYRVYDIGLPIVRINGFKEI